MGGLHRRVVGDVTANDFVYSWRRLVDPATASPYNTIIAMVKNANEIIGRRAAQGGAGRRRSRRAHL